MSKPYDLSHRVFGLLSVIAKADNRQGKTMWLCRCECGRHKTFPAGRLIRGDARSCGCWRAVLAKARFSRHGKSGSRVYNIWCQVMRRCLDPGDPRYARYGARGITVCERWRKFENFFADMGEPPDRHSIDRIDNRGGYSPDNCRWATAKQQSANSTRPVVITLNGESRNLSEWARYLGISPSTLIGRFAAGWPVELALTTGPTHRSRSPMRAI